MNDANRTKKLTFTALAIAIIFVLTRFTQIPIPFGYMHFGNVAILLASAYLGTVPALLAAAIGSGLADLTSFPVWVIPTIIIKGGMAFAGASIIGTKFQPVKLGSPRVILGNITQIAIMIIGYFIVGAFLYGGAAASATQLPGLAFEGIAAIVLFFVIANALERAKLIKRLSN